MTFEEMKNLPEDKQEELFQKLTEERQKAKTVSYSAVYGVGAAKLARELQVPQKEAKNLLEAYWKKNWAVNKVAEGQYVKTLKDGSTWLKNPVSGFYHQLRFEKDRWSTTNQSTGDYCFNLWVLFLRQMGYKLSLNYHDEVLVQVEEDADEDKIRSDFKEAMQKVNQKLGLNVDIGVEVKFGKSYSECH